MSKKSDNTYYEKGSEEVSTITAVTLKKLEQRRKLTRNSEKLVICLVGLPGRGKSFVARKLHSFLTWRGAACRVFNVGKYRRDKHANATKSRRNSLSEGSTNGAEPAQVRDNIGACDASFFDPNNPVARAIRKEAASAAMKDMIEWLDDDHNENENGKKLYREDSCNRFRESWGHERVAIFDATNSTVERRTWVLEECTSPTKRAGKKTGVVFVESICNDDELLNENFMFKIQNSPDFQGMTEEVAIADLRMRCQKYEEQYETIDDDTLSYIKIFNLSSKLLVNHIYGRMAKTIVPALMSWNIGSRPIYFCRPGQTSDTIPGIPSSPIPKKIARGDKLGSEGRCFRDILSEFIEQEGRDFMVKRAQASAPSLVTGTSVSGLMSLSSYSVTEQGEGSGLPFPCYIMSSTMPRAVETATWNYLPFPVHQLSNLNPLDKGDFSGMELEEIKEIDPEWYASLEKDPFRTRFPGGECYGDLINRLESCVIDIEQQVGMVVMVGHISILQVLLAYFRRTPVEKCTSIEVPLHTVIKFSPVRGGGWVESTHSLMPEYFDTDSDEEPPPPSTPIWGDHKKSNSCHKLEKVE